MKPIKSTTAFLIFIVIASILTLKIFAKIYYPSTIRMTTEIMAEEYKSGNNNKAIEEATRVLNQCKAFKFMTWGRNYLVCSDGYHYAHTILGLVAISENNIQEATKELLLSGQSPYSYTILKTGFPPKMTLAKQLLLKGEKGAVLNYLELCAEFWDGSNYLERWSEMIKNGKVPEFGDYEIL